jgi:hypothetical protein
MRRPYPKHIDEDELWQKLVDQHRHKRGFIIYREFVKDSFEPATPIKGIPFVPEKVNNEKYDFT